MSRELGRKQRKEGRRATHYARLRLCTLADDEGGGDDGHYGVNDEDSHYDRTQR